MHYENIPVFAPEFFNRVRPLDSMKRKQFQKGISQLAEEGAIQTFLRTETCLLYTSHTGYPGSPGREYPHPAGTARPG